MQMNIKVFLLPLSLVETAAPINMQPAHPYNHNNDQAKCSNLLQTCATVLFRSGLVHKRMDHAHHSHDSPSHSSMQSSEHSMDMKMYFNTDLHYTLLFSSWVINSVGKAIIACFGSFIFAIIYEALETLRHKLLLRAACNNQCGRGENSYGGGPSCPGCPNPSDSNSNNGYLNPNKSNEEVHVNVVSNSYRQRLRTVILLDPFNPNPNYHSISEVPER
ncbi:unnamed protein product [Schistosoma turkestanicum]|nr:unnamed protein product [Schistosoma turkestanicum]